MKFERTFEASVSVEVARNRARAYMEQAGYDLAESGRQFTFVRGSLAGKWFSANPKNGLVEIEVEILENCDVRTRQQSGTLHIYLAPDQGRVKVQATSEIGIGYLTNSEFDFFTAELEELETAVNRNEISNLKSSGFARKTVIKGRLGAAFAAITILAFAAAGRFVISGHFFWVGMMVGTVIGTILSLTILFYWWGFRSK